MAHLTIQGPAYVSGCRHCYTVFTDARLFIGRIYVVSEEYPNQRHLRRLSDGAVSFELQPFEQLNTAEEVTAWGETIHRRLGSVTERPSQYVAADALSDTELLNQAAQELHRLSCALTRRYAAWHAQYTKGPWEVGYIGTPGRDTSWSAAKSVPAGVLRFDAGAVPHFAVRHRSGALARVRPYWRSSDPGNPYAWLTLDLAVVWLSGDGKPLPKHVADWIKSRCDPK